MTAPNNPAPGLAQRIAEAIINAGEDHSNPDETLHEIIQYELAQDPVLRGVRSLLAETSADYNHPQFTDRHRCGPRLRAALANLDAEMKGSK